jgi:hypothetical protein
VPHEATHRDERAGTAARTEPLPRERREKGGEVRSLELPGLRDAASREMLDEAGEVAAVGLHRARRQALLDTHVGQEAFESAVELVARLSHRAPR